MKFSIDSIKIIDLTKADESSFHKRFVGCLVLTNNNKILLQQRGNDWDRFPGYLATFGGRIELEETAPQALVRELKEELGVQLKASKHLFDVKHFYTQFKVDLSVFACSLEDDPKIDATHQWVSMKSFSKYPMPSGSAKIIEKIILLDKR